VNNSIPGVGYRARLEDIFDNPRFVNRISAFYAPVTGSLLTRFGVGIDVGMALTNESTTIKAGDLTGVAALALIGVSP
jgi:hypothetical protein